MSIQNGVIMAVSVNDTELTLTARPDRWLVAVNDRQGLLHLTEFSRDISDLSDALDWFHVVSEVLTEHHHTPTAISSAKLVNTLTSIGELH